MPLTPDRRHGPLEEDEEIRLGSNPTPPSMAGALNYNGTSFVLRDSLGSFNPRSAGASGLVEYNYNSSEASSSTSSNVFQQKLRLSVSVTGGTYLVFWHSLITTSSANKDFQAQVQLNDVSTLSLVQFRVPIANQDYIFCGFSPLTLSAGAHFVDLDWSSTSASATLISLARLALWKAI